MGVGLVVAGQDLGDRGVPQGPLRGRTHRPGVEGPRGDLNTVLAQHAADRSDPEAVPVISNELTHLRCAQRRERGSLSRAKKDVAALRISMVCSSSALRRLSARISAAASLETPSRSPSSTCRCRIQVRNVSGVIPSRFDTAVIAAHSLVVKHQTDSPRPRLRIVLARHEMHLPKTRGAHQTRDGSAGSCDSGDQPGDRVSAAALARQVLVADRGNAEAEDLLTAPGEAGEIRRLTILFADLVDSTVLSTRVEPETYRMVVGRYRGRAA